MGRGDIQASVSSNGQPGPGDHTDGQRWYHHEAVQDWDFVEPKLQHARIVTLRHCPLDEGSHDNASTEHHPTNHVPQEECSLWNGLHECGPRTVEVVDQDKGTDRDAPDAERDELELLLVVNAARYLLKPAGPFVFDQSSGGGSGRSVRLGLRQSIGLLLGRLLEQLEVQLRRRGQPAGLFAEGRVLRTDSPRRRGGERRRRSYQDRCGRDSDGSRWPSPSPALADIHSCRPC
mmetsp:Transcript_37787/g.90391  ORF Transcript_37787/g.90391 Transcript_37787/m.90391 type:complete len:233 (-) Transcript_37787:75-773(-)